MQAISRGEAMDSVRKSSMKPE